MQIKWIRPNIGSNEISCVLDTTLCQTFNKCKKFYSVKHDQYGVKYQIGINPYTGLIVELSGPFYGSAHDLTIFRHTIKSTLRSDERIFGDKAYIGENQIVTPYKGRRITSNMKRFNQMHIRVMGLIERLNGRLKKFQILNCRYRSSHFSFHQAVVKLICKLYNNFFFKIKLVS